MVSLGLTTTLILPEDHWDDSFIDALASDPAVRSIVGAAGYHYGGQAQKHYHDQLDRCVVRQNVPHTPQSPLPHSA